MSRYRDRQFPPYVSVGERRVKAQNKLAQLKKKNPRIRPVVIQGSRLACTWWGIAWNRNLERYADYTNRIGRGRSYVRHGAVLDLQVEPGRVTALVQGSRSTPYQVEVRIRSLDAKAWEAIRRACAGGFDSLQVLLAGKFPQTLADLFTAPGHGLFPTPQEIEFDCSCPDWAEMCKHVAATLYGIGARLDEDPSLFFELRRVKMLDLIGEAVRETSEQLLQKADGRSASVIADADISEVFGIVMEDSLDFENVPSVQVKVPAPAARKRVKKAAQGPQPRPRGEGVDEKRVLDLVLASPDGIDVPTLCSRTGFSTAEVRKVIYAAHRSRLIVKVSRGIFRGPQKRRDPVEETRAVMDCIRSAPQGTGAAHIKAVTRLPDAIVRSILAKAHREGKLKRVSRGVYAVATGNRNAPSMTRMVLDAIRDNPEGATVADIRERTGLFDRQVSNILFRLLRLARIRRSARGVYQVM